MCISPCMQVKFHLLHTMLLCAKHYHRHASAHSTLTFNFKFFNRYSRDLMVTITIFCYISLPKDNKETKKEGTRHIKEIFFPFRSNNYGILMGCINHGFSTILCLCSNICCIFNCYTYVGFIVSVSLLNINLITAMLKRYHFLTSLTLT